METCYIIHFTKDCDGKSVFFQDIAPKLNNTGTTMESQLEDVLLQKDIQIFAERRLSDVELSLQISCATCLLLAVQNEYVEVT